MPAVSQAQDLQEVGMVFQFGRPPNRIDLLSKVDGIEFEEAWSSRVTATLLFSAHESVQVPYLGLKCLIATKEAAGRPKDLEDLRYLRALSTES